MPSAVDTGNFFLFELCLIRVNHSHHKILCCTVICNFKHLLIEKLDAHCKLLNSNWPWEIVCVVVEFPLFPHKCPHIFLDMEVASHMRHHWFKLIHIISVKDSLNAEKTQDLWYIGFHWWCPGFKTASTLLFNSRFYHFQWELNSRLIKLKVTFA